MERHSLLNFALVCMLVSIGCLLYLEWWRAGELEELNGRMNETHGEVVELRHHLAKLAEKKPAAARTRTRGAS